MRYTVENTAGDELEVHDTLTAATRSGVERLEDDPELGELLVYEVGRTAPTGTHMKTITHGPDANWDTIVVVLEPGERIGRPGYVPRQITEEDLEGYELGDPKRIGIERAIGTWI